MSPRPRPSRPARAQKARPPASLAAYRRRRDFSKTAEPEGVAGGEERRRYVIQKHAARRLHYDFRLELGGALKSWAVPKGPSTDPAAKRLAVHVEDHPIEYGDFEGTIPKGEYGGGTVMLWDRGQWEPLSEPEAAYRKGRLKFRLHGERLRGVWNLVRMGGRQSEGGKNWLLFKEREAETAAAGAQPVERWTTGVSSGRTMDEIGSGGTRVWRSERPVGARATRTRGSKARATTSASARRAAKPSDVALLPGAKRGGPPASFSPQLATLVREVPEGEDWLHEIKLDGYRMLAFVERGRVRLVTRNGHDWTARFPSLARAVRELPLHRGVLDGEAVALDGSGRSRFQLLQNALEGGKTELAYYLFDLPFAEGYDLRAVPLVERKTALAALFAGGVPRELRYSDHVRGNGVDVFRHACDLAVEGVVSKRADSAYEARRTRSWLKVKCSKRQELVVAGWTDPRGSRTGFGALLLAHHDDAGRLVYSGKVGTGFDGRTIASLGKRLRPLRTDAAPFDVAPPRSEVRGAHWVEPSVVVEVEFTEWTADGRLRHPTFVGLREDKRPEEVVREKPADRPAAKENVAASRPRAVASVKLSHPDRVLWPEQALTKAQLAAYYERVAERMLPHVVGRPLAIVRCPEGRTKPCFFQKHLTESLPSGIRGAAVEERAGSAKHLMIEGLEGLIGLVQIGALEIHPWGARADRLDRPDRIVFDLDPGPDVGWPRIVSAAERLRGTLERHGLESFVRTSGGKGLHLVVPIERRWTWDVLKAFARRMAEDLVRAEPASFVSVASKAQRKGKIYVDWLRNSRGATAIASYSTRAREGAPVSMPLAWSEIAKIEGGEAFTVQTIATRLRKPDPWAGFFELRQVPRAPTAPKARPGRRAAGGG